MPLSPSPIQTEPERGLALQKYLLLHSQHDALQKHLDRIMISSSSPSLSPSSSSSSTSTINSFSSSPESASPSTTFSTHPHHQRPNLNKRRSSLPTELCLVEETVDESINADADIDPAMHDQIATQEHKLRDVNLQIKTTLTELLGCESVRLDKRYRTWVQTRLMGAEQELKGERRAATRARGGSWVA